MLRLDRLEVEKDRFRRFEQQMNKFYLCISLAIFIPLILILIIGCFSGFYLTYEILTVHFVGLTSTVLAIYHTISMLFIWTLRKYHRLAYTSHWW